MRALPDDKSLSSWQFPEFGEKVSPEQQEVLDRLRANTQRRRGLERLFGMLWYHTSSRVKRYKGEEMQKFIDKISGTVDDLAEHGIVFSPPDRSSASAQDWAGFVKQLESISPDVYRGVYEFDPERRALNPGALFQSEPYREQWTLEETMRESLPGLNMRDATYTTQWQDFLNTAFGGDRQVTENNPEKYVHLLDRKVLPRLIPALPKLFSLHSEELIRGMMDIRSRVHAIVERDGADAPELEVLRVGEFRKFLHRICNLHEDYAQVDAHLVALSEQVRRAVYILKMDIGPVGKYTLGTDTIAMELLKIDRFARLMVRKVA